MPAYMTSFKSGATPTAVKASVIIPTKNPGRSFAAFCLQCSRRKPASASTSWSSIRVLRTARSNLCAALRINACVSWKFRRPNLATARRAIWPFRKPPANTQCSSLMMHSRTICIGLLPWWPGRFRPRIAGVFGRHCAYPEASPYTKRDLDGHFGNFAGQPVVWLDDKARYDRDEPYRQRLHFFSDNNALVRRSVWEQIPYPDVDFAEDQIWAQQIIEAGWKRAMRMMAWSTIRTISPCSKTAAQFRRIACAVSFVRLCLVTKRQAHAAHLAGVDTQRSRLCACRRLSSQPFRYCGQDAAPQPDASNRALPRLTRPTITGVRAQLAFGTGA